MVVDVGDGVEVRCIGFLLIGGGAFFDFELVVDVDRRRFCERLSVIET